MGQDVYKGFHHRVRPEDMELGQMTALSPVLDNRKPLPGRGVEPDSECPATSAFTRTTIGGGRQLDIRMTRIR
jgi:hypothetical protein